MNVVVKLEELTCLYVNEFIGLPPNNGVRMITRRAGKLTPELRVLVATITRNDRFEKAVSIISLSSNVKPA